MEDEATTLNGLSSLSLSLFHIYYIANNPSLASISVSDDLSVDLSIFNRDADSHLSRFPPCVYLNLLQRLGIYLEGSSIARTKKFESVVHLLASQLFFFSARRRRSVSRSPPPYIIHQTRHLASQLAAQDWLRYEDSCCKLTWRKAFLLRRQRSFFRHCLPLLLLQSMWKKNEEIFSTPFIMTHQPQCTYTLAYPNRVACDRLFFLLFFSLVSLYAARTIPPFHHSMKLSRGKRNKERKLLRDIRRRGSCWRWEYVYHTSRVAATKKKKRRWTRKGRRKEEQKQISEVFVLFSFSRQDVSLSLEKRASAIYPFFVSLIQKERERYPTNKLLFFFLLFLVISFVKPPALPFSQSPSRTRSKTEKKRQRQLNRRRDREKERQKRERKTRFLYEWRDSANRYLAKSETCFTEENGATSLSLCLSVKKDRQREREVDRWTSFEQRKASETLWVNAGGVLYSLQVNRDLCCCCCCLLLI